MKKQYAVVITFWDKTKQYECLPKAEARHRAKALKNNGYNATVKYRNVIDTYL